MINMSIPNLEGNERKYLNQCIDSTFVSSVGEFVNRFEADVARVTGSEFAVATSAGTTGIHAALMAVGVSSGDLVIVPTFTFIASANAVMHCGAKPWLMDVRPEDWCMDPELVKTEIALYCEMKDGKLIHRPTGKRVAALMPVYTLGNVPKMDDFREIADQYNLPLVADAACAVGAKFRNRKIGGLADLSVLSFNGNKTVTCGGGGAVVGNDPQLMQKVKHLTTTARVGTEYDFDMVGYNYRMTNLQAAVGCAQLERLDSFLCSKREIHAYYAEHICGLGVVPFPATDQASFWLSGIVLPEGFGISEIRQICNILKECGIEARSFWKPVHLQTPYAHVPIGKTEFSEWIWDRILTLPCSTGITDEELNEVVDSVRFSLNAVIG